MYLTRILLIFSSLVPLNLATDAFIQLPIADDTGGSNSQSDCICVPAQRCNDLFLNLKYETRTFCTSPDICCPSENVIKRTTEECGIRKHPHTDIPRIASEFMVQTSFGEFPWMALILTNKIARNGNPTENEIVCGASILSDSVILTAAHCVSKYRPDELIIRVGEYDVREDVNEPKSHQDRSVHQISFHPQYNSKTLYNDIALIKVSQKFVFDSHIAPICLPLTSTQFADPASYDPENCFAAGWGRQAFDETESDNETTLRKVDLTFVERNQCQSLLRKTRLGRRFTLHHSFICAVAQPGSDTCKGNGGGPLVCASVNNPNQYIQVGIISWGIGCANGLPGVYASLFANQEWLTTQSNKISMFE